MNEKFDRDRVEKEKNEHEKINHLKYSVSNDFITENTLTCQSHFQNTRVIKYHWKGMNEDEKNDILRTIDQQREEKDVILTNIKIIKILIHFLFSSIILFINYLVR